MGTSGGSGGGATGELVGGDTLVPLGEWGRGYRGTNGRRRMGTSGGSGGGATGELVGGDTLVPLGEWGRGYRGTSGR